METKRNVTYFVSEIKRVENYPNFENVIQQSVQGFITENIEGESTGPNDLSHILYQWVFCVNNSKCCQHFHKP